MSESIKGLMRTHHCGELTASNVGHDVELCGWVNKDRDLGGVHFIDLRDKFGLTQLNFTQFKGDASLFSKVSLESVLKVKGKVTLRPDEAKNKKMATGEVEVMVTEMKVLSTSDKDNMPFLPYGATQATEDNKLKYRYLDLRTQKLQNILKLRSDASMRVRNTLMGEGFVEVETPILYKSTPEGARDYVVPSRIHPGKVYALPQSPQTLKQLLMIGGTDKYFQIVKCFRDEDLRADRQPEFTQIDIEVSFPTMEYMKNLSETLLKKIYGLEDHFTLTPMSYQQAVEDYGSDKPDVRFALKHMNVTALFQDSAFGTFKSVAESQGLIKAIFVPEKMGTFSRKDVDALVDVVKPYGGKGVAWFKVSAEGRTGGISKFIDDKIYKSLDSLSPEKGNGTWFFCADTNHDVSHASLDAVRRHFGKMLSLIEDGYKFLWLYDFPLYEWSEDDKRFFARHHPFTMPKHEDLDGFMSGNHEALLNCRAEAYDVVCNGYELGGGSLRIYDQEVQAKMFEYLGMTEEETKHQFGFFLEALKYGTPPHGGIAFGLDRIMMLLAGTDNIRDVIAFPKTTSATDLMSSSPSAPSKAQIEELHFDWVK